MSDITSSVDEILKDTCDLFDEECSNNKLNIVHKMVRKTTNHLFMIFRAFSRTIYELYQVLLSSKGRYDPARCSDDELLSCCRMVGTQRIQGKKSLLNVVFKLKNRIETEVISANTEISYVSINGDKFTYKLNSDLVFKSNDNIKVVQLESELIGKYSVSDIENASITLSEESEKLENFEISIQDNSSLLGKAEETDYELRERLLSVKDKQDIVEVLVEKIKELPNIFDCYALYNNNEIEMSFIYDEDKIIQIPTNTLLLIINGRPTESLVDIFLSGFQYTTCDYPTIENRGSVVIDNVPYRYKEGDTWKDGFKLNFLYFVEKKYNIIIKYKSDEQKISNSEIRENFTKNLESLKINQNHIDELTTEDVFDLLTDLNLISVKILDIKFKQEDRIYDYLTFRKIEKAVLDEIEFRRVNN